MDQNDTRLDLSVMQVLESLVDVEVAGGFDLGSDQTFADKIKAVSLILRSSQKLPMMVNSLKANLFKSKVSLGE